ncbi:MAG: carboxypeptidase-like regulatory domain-containing protein [Thermoplasmatota archaeon]
MVVVRVPLVTLLFVVTLLAGCSSDDGGGVQEIVVESAPIETVESEGDGADGEAGAPPPVVDDKKGKRGHLAGFVVNDVLRPIEGATVSLPGVDLDHDTDRDGGFAFADLIPGPYLLRANVTGHEPAEAIVEIKPGEFTRVKFVLERIRPPEPYHETIKFEGFSDITGNPFDFGLTGIFGCNTCVWDHTFSPGLHSIVIEAAMDPYTGVGVGGAAYNSFYYSLRDVNCCSSYAYGTHSNPMRVEVTPEQLGANADGIEIRVEPESFPAPETNKRFEVYVTAFYNGGPPEGWSFLEDA